MSHKLKIEDIKKYVEETSESGCKLISTEYFGDSYKLIFQCKCGKEFEKKFSTFKCGQMQCPECGIKTKSDKRRFTYDYIKNFIEVESNSGCKLISSKYSNSHSKILIKCSCGRDFETTYSEFSHSNKRQCNDCSFKNNGLNQTYTYEQVKHFIEIESNSNCQLVSDEYSKSDVKMVIMCSCGEEFDTTFDAFKNQNKRQCNECGKRMFSIKKTKEVKFTCSNCEKECTTKPYRLKDHKHKYCSITCRIEHQKNILVGENNPRWSGGNVSFNCDYCGKENSMPRYQYNSTKNHYCDMKCLAKHRETIYSKEGSPRWDNTISQEERETKRKYKEYTDFVNETYKRDKYTCQVCGDDRGGNLNAHHLNSHNVDIENRTNVSNSITLCEKCHTDFHKKFGYGDNTKNQFIEYLISCEKYDLIEVIIKRFQDINELLEVI